VSSAEFDELAGLLGGEFLALDQREDGGAHSLEAVGAHLGEGIFGSIEDISAGIKNGGGGDTASELGDECLNLSTSLLAGRA
jgi:hypothetical protein